MNQIQQAIRERHKDATGSVGVLSAFSSETTTKEAGNDRILRIVVTTDDVDLVGDVVDPKGADLSYITRKGQNKVFADHQYDMEHCIGSLRYLTYHPTGNSPKGLMAAIAMRKGHKLADEAWTIAKEMGIGASIGFDASEITDYKNGDPMAWKSASSVIRKWRLLEVSLTCLPCNVACQSEGMSSPDDSKMAMLDALVTKGRVSRETAKAFGLDSKNVFVPKFKIVSGLT